MSAHFDIPVGNPPCDTCNMAQACAELKMVCEAFTAYAYGKKWQGVIRNPSTQLFQKMYHVQSPEEAAERERKLAAMREKSKRTLESKGISTGRKRGVYERRRCPA